MALNRFDYYAPERIEEACKLLNEKGEGAMVLAGGTDLVPKFHRGAVAIKSVVDLQKISGLDEISFDEAKGLTIGAMARLADVAEHPVVKEKYPAIAAAALATANPQIRHMGTVAGNICNASPSADNAPTLLAMNATLTLVSESGERVIPIDGFFKGVGLSDLKKGEILTAIQIPLPPTGSGSDYQYISARGKVDISAVCAGAQVVMENGVCKEARIFLGAVAPTPIRAKEAEKKLIGQSISEKLLQDVGVAASGECTPITDMRASAEYRKTMVAVLTARAVGKACKLAS